MVSEGHDGNDMMVAGKIAIGGFRKMCHYSWNDVDVVVCNDNNVDKVVVHQEEWLGQRGNGQWGQKYG